MDQTFTPARAALLPAVCLGRKGMPPLSPYWWGYLLHSSPQKEYIKSCLKGSHTGSITSMLLLPFKEKGRDHFSGFPVGSGFWRSIPWVPVCHAGRFLESLSKRDKGNQALGRLPSDHGQRKGHTEGGFHVLGLLHELAQELTTWKQASLPSGHSSCWTGHPKRPTHS